MNFDDDMMNPHFAYSDENNIRHDVWFLDGVTALQPDASAHALGIDTFALWRLGSEDRSLWAVWDKPFEAAAPEKLDIVPPGQDVDIEGQGEILRIQVTALRRRTQHHVNSDNLVNDEVFKTCPCRMWSTCTAERRRRKSRLPLMTAPTRSGRPRFSMC